MIIPSHQGGAIVTPQVPWYDSHSTSINACSVWEVRTGVQVFRREFRTHIHLDYVRVEFYLVSKKKNNNNNLTSKC